MSEKPKVTDEVMYDTLGFAKVHPLKRAVRTKAFPLFILLLAVIAAFAVISPLRNNGKQAFFQINTIWFMLQDITVTGLLTIGSACLIVSGQIDLSNATVGSMAGVIIAVGTHSKWWGIPWWSAIIIAIAVAAVAGFVNALLVNELKLPPFVATMATSTVMTAVISIMTTNSIGNTELTISFTDESITQLATFTVWNKLTAASVFMVLLFIIYGVVLAKTKFGRTLYLVGGNRAATHLAGINPKKTSYFLYINCSVLAALAGICNVSRTGSGSSGALSAYTFSGLTAAILGGISFFGGSGGMGGAFIGLMLLNVFNRGLVMSKVDPYFPPIFRGTLLLLALTFDSISIRLQNRRVGA